MFLTSNTEIAYIKTYWFEQLFKKYTQWCHAPDC